MVKLLVEVRSVVGFQFEKKIISKVHQTLDNLAAEVQLIRPDSVIVDLLTADLAKHQTMTQTALTTPTSTQLMTHFLSSQVPHS